MPHIFDELERRFSKYKDVTLVKKALGARRAIQEMYVHRLSGESSSFLTPSALYDGFFDGARLPLEPRSRFLEGVEARRKSARCKIGAAREGCSG